MRLRRRPAAMAVVGLYVVMGSVFAADAPVPWRGGWVSLRDPDRTIAAAKETRFNALLVGGPPERLQAFAEKTAKEGIETYWWCSIIAAKDADHLKQIMPPEDEKRLAEINADKDPKKGGFQFGGEPLAGHHDILTSPLLCFHRAEAVERARKQVKEMLEACPALTGVALDYFGYQNLRSCVCPRSLELLAAHRASHPGLAPKRAEAEFYRDTLVRFTNEMADYIREVRPGAKIAIHVYPVFLPEPLYGNRLDVDYCCQTVAWFFEPYWSKEKIAEYCRTVVRDARRYHPRQQGIPFVGVYIGRPYADKSPARLAEELSIIREACGSYSLSICSFNACVESEEMMQVLKADAARMKP